MLVDTSKVEAIQLDLASLDGVTVKVSSPTDSGYASAFTSPTTQKLSYLSVDHGRGTKVSPGLQLCVASSSSECSCLAGCRCSSLPNVKSVLVVLKGTGVIRTEDAVLCASDRPEYFYSSSPIFKVLPQFCKRRPPRQSVGRRVLTRVALAKVTKPVTYFGSKTELTWVFRYYVNIVLEARRVGMNLVNISLENLAIAPRDGLIAGKGIITCYDDSQISSSQKRLLFVYTMPCRTLLPNYMDNRGSLEGLESLLLCMLWITTTRIGPLNAIRDSYAFHFDSTELGRWNSRILSYDPSGREQERRKRRVMQNKDLFESEVLSDVHTCFDKIKNFLRCLRVLVYDPQWERTRNLICHADPKDLKDRQVLVGMFQGIITDAAKRDKLALKRALSTPVLLPATSMAELMKKNKVPPEPLK